MKKCAALLAAAAMTAAAWGAVPASYPGGAEAMETYLSENTSYPSAARANGIEGVVTVAFNVGADGKISGAKVVRPVDPDLEAEALRVVNAMPVWAPAKDDAGNAVASQAKVEVVFAL